MTPSLSVVILAAGQGSRMKSRIPKVLHPLAGRPLIAYPAQLAQELQAQPLCVVVGSGHELVVQAVHAFGATTVQQPKPLGTGDAVRCAAEHLGDLDGMVLILSGDVPLVTAETISAFVNEVRERHATLGFITVELPDAGQYGRVVRDAVDRVLRIVEARDASPDELAINEINTGIYCANARWLFSAVRDIKPDNAQHEYYLTDVVALALQQRHDVLAWRASNAEEFLGINTQADLERVAQVMRRRINRRHMAQGVSMQDASTTYVDADARIGAGSVLFPGCFVLGNTQLGSDCVIEPGVILRDAQIADRVQVKAHTIIENSSVAEGAVIGPFARLRPESQVGADARVGNFVEIKKSELGTRVKVNHLSYIGDAQVGADTNIGCGTITCNYDGHAKHRTLIGEKVFVGSDTQFVAPVNIGAGATIGAGSTITKDVSPGSLALARAEQVEVKEWQPRWKRSESSSEKG